MDLSHLRALSFCMLSTVLLRYELHECFLVDCLITDVLADVNHLIYLTQAAVIVQHMLSREDNWNSWKNDSCPNFIRKSDDPKPKALTMARCVTHAHTHSFIAKLGLVPELLCIVINSTEVNLLRPFMQFIMHRCYSCLSSQ